MNLEQSICKFKANYYKTWLTDIYTFVNVLLLEYILVAVDMTRIHPITSKWGHGQLGH